MNDRLREKVARESALTADESLQLDVALESQAAVAEAVSRLPESEASLAWRSALNERLGSARDGRRRGLILRWGSGSLATAAAVTALVVAIGNFEPSTAPTASGSIEEILVSAHRDAEGSVRVDWTDSLRDPALGSL